MMKKIRVLLVAFCAIMTLQSQASHITASEIFYRHVANNDYRISLTLFRDCAGIQVAPSVTIDISSSCNTFTATAFPVDTNEITPSCMTQLSTCNGGSWPGREVYLYEATVTLQPCADWVLSYSMCCRNSLGTNIMNPSANGVYLESTLDNSNGPNSSPTFMHSPNPYYCSTGACINNTAYDFDGDSLAFSLVSPRDDGGANVTFVSPYSATQPFGTAGTFNPFSGNVCVDSTLGAGGFVFAVKVDEYRNGQIVGSVIRDAQFILANCNPPDTMTIEGTVVDGLGSQAVGAWVKLYEYDITQGTMPVIDSALSNGAGFYSISTTTYGQYMVKAFPDTLTNPNTLPSYHMGSYYWNTGQVIFSMCDSVVNGNIVLADQGNPVGIGAVSGYMYGYGLLRGGFPDQPESGIYIYVIDRSTGAQVAHSVTDINGYYEIPTLEPGDYELLAEIPGLVHISTHRFTITSNESYTNFNLVATDDGIYATSSTLGVDEIQRLERFRVYPNPSSDIVMIDGIAHPAVFEILSIEGRKVKTGQLSPRAHMSVSDLAPGMYIMKIDGYRSERFVVE